MVLFPKKDSFSTPFRMTVYIALDMNYNRMTTKWWRKIHPRAFPQALHLSSDVEWYEGETEDKHGFSTGHAYIDWRAQLKTLRAQHLQRLLRPCLSLFLHSVAYCSLPLSSSFILFNFFPKSRLSQPSYSLPWAAYPPVGSSRYKGHLGRKENSQELTKQPSICLKVSSCLEIVPWKWIPHLDFALGCVSRPHSGSLWAYLFLRTDYSSWLSIWSRMVMKDWGRGLVGNNWRNIGSECTQRKNFPDFHHLYFRTMCFHYADWA